MTIKVKEETKYKHFSNTLFPPEDINKTYLGGIQR